MVFSFEKLINITNMYTKDNDREGISVSSRRTNGIRVRTSSNVAKPIVMLAELGQITIDFFFTTFE